jgi:hypothetical protein
MEIYTKTQLIHQYHVILVLVILIILELLVQTVFSLAKMQEHQHQLVIHVIAHLDQDGMVMIVVFVILLYYVMEEGQLIQHVQIVFVMLHGLEIDVMFVA